MQGSGIGDRGNTFAPLRFKRGGMREKQERKKIYEHSTWEDSMELKTVQMEIPEDANLICSRDRTGARSPRRDRRVSSEGRGERRGCAGAEGIFEKDRV